VGLSVYLSSLPRHVANPAGPPRPPEDTKPNIETGGRDFRRPCTTIALAHRLPSRLIPAAAWHDRVLPYDQRRIAHLRGPLPHRGHFSPSVMAIVLAAIGQDGAVHPVFSGGDAGEVQGPTQRISSQLLTDGMTQPVPDSVSTGPASPRREYPHFGISWCIRVHSGAFAGI
jgi:hypothetical protein